MNERILELRTQAAAWVSENHQPQDPNAYSQKEIDQRYLMYEEKFAELIVKECINEIHVADVGDLKAKGYYLDKVAEHIEKHFGVQ